MKRPCPAIRSPKSAVARAACAGRATAISLSSSMSPTRHGPSRALLRSDLNRDGSLVGNLRSLGFAALAAMKLNITVNGLTNGRHIECKSLDEVLGAEEALMTACKNLQSYLDTAATFDGREVLIDFSGGEPEVVADSRPRPQSSSKMVLGLGG